ncbi:LysR family transcriptional regulator [Methylobacterium sp. 17Sr1-1]|uniref:LysR family transcriptional regulator n=1 Tax=Methylobacterium sp. 17Sr1-1 TaxID=2202826 RepID=UPI000D6F9521|nr:LysR family transcriptional regulator [Methylobacterium sp. 17Sr1-1]AWN51088.1 LysR family transcriptional regulator [Methylobacterium sp. 17Sr1-1]
MAVPDLGDLSSFMRVADAGGFRAAAQRHGISASSLSDAVQRLEQAVGVRLFNRTTRSVVPTEAGQRLLDRVRPALAEITVAYEGVTQDGEPGGTLKLDVPGVVARHILPPIAAAFLTAHPRIQLEISVTDGLVDVMAAGCVAGIRYGEHIAADMMAVPIGPRRQRYVGVASPAYLAAHGTPHHPAELATHVGIGHLFPSGRVSDWEFERNGERIKVKPQGRLTTGSSDIQIAAAVAGHGILFAFEEFVAPHIQRGELTVLLSNWPQEFDGPRIYFPRSHRRDPALAAFLRFIKAP